MSRLKTWNFHVDQFTPSFEKLWESETSGLILKIITVTKDIFSCTALKQVIIYEKLYLGFKSFRAIDRELYMSRHTVAGRKLWSLSSICIGCMNMIWIIDVRPRHEYRPPHMRYYNNIFYRDDKPFCVNSIGFYYYYFFSYNKVRGKVIYRDRKIYLYVCHRKINQFTNLYSNDIVLHSRAANRTLVNWPDVTQWT